MIGAALAIDHGTKKTGFAVSDALGVSIEPLGVFQGTGEALLDRIGELLAERTIRTFVVGLPLNADGTPGPRAQDAEAFGKTLQARFPDQELAWVDERWTTKEAEARLTDAGFRGKERKARKDAWAAALLLEEWLRTK